jgi:indole-3-glycerol phosphate synthase
MFQTVFGDKLMNILDKILETKRREVSESLRRVGRGELLRRAEAVSRRPVSFSGAIRAKTPAIIAEFKRCSPSKGFINRNADPVAVARGYASGGAAAMSALTDCDYFGGSLSDLVAVRAAVDIPLLRKDFIIDESQICEARTAGADAVLLIAAALDRSHCADLAAFAHTLDLEVLLEVHNEAELGHINGVDAVGVNNRDLTTFTTDTALSLKLVGLLPAGLTRVSESGISSSATVRELHRAGFDGFLMGENFMRRDDPAVALRKFIAEL